MPKAHVNYRFSALAAVLATLVMLGAFLARPPASYGATPRCATSNLSLEFTRGEGATSHRTWDLALRNTGTITCHVRGYPGVGLLDSHAQLLNVTVVRVSGAVRTVVLRPWDRAFFTFGFVVSGPCAHGIFPFGLQVIPPNSTLGLRMYRRFDVCGGSHPQVTPARAIL